VAGVEALVSRTGYTGEEAGFELFVRPREAPELWKAILAEGEDAGVRPAGLVARDSTRTEAGFPLYGHELAGKYDIAPQEAGYGAFVKRHKPFFVGRAALLKREAERTRKVVRFAMKGRNIRMVRPGDPVVGPKGSCVGFVTSCAMVDKAQVGLAYVEREGAAVGARLGIFILPHKETPEKPKPQLDFGDRVLTHEEAEVLPRFAAFE
jgi:glycine hydroxymethyltransferase